MNTIRWDYLFKKSRILKDLFSCLLHTIVYMFAYRVIFFFVNLVVDENIVNITNVLFILLGILVVLIKYTCLLMRFKPGFCTEIWGQPAYMAIIFAFFSIHYFNLMEISFTHYIILLFIIEYLISIKIINSVLQCIYVIFCARSLNLKSPLYKLSRKLHRCEPFRFILFDVCVWSTIFFHVITSLRNISELLNMLLVYTFGALANLFFWCYRVNAITQYRLYRIYLCQINSLHRIIHQQLHLKEKISYFLCAMFLVIYNSRYNSHNIIKSI
jgi:hypothetical protein